MHLHRLLGLLWTLAVLALAGCERERTGIVDTAGSAPFLTEAVLTPAAVDTDTILVGPVKQPEDELTVSSVVTARVRRPVGHEQLTRSYFAVRKEAGGSSIAAGELRAADSGESNEIYLGKLSFTLKRSEIGTYYVEVYAEAPGGYRSNSLFLPFAILRSNLPPQLSDLQAPDTVRLTNQDQLLVLRVRASDPNGREDIQRVIFNSFKPDGTPSTGNPFQMYDDGDPNHGDDVAGDGIYSLRIVLPASTTPGSYRFEFRAFDRSNEGSNVIVHRITVTS